MLLSVPYSVENMLFKKALHVTKDLCICVFLQNICLIHVKMELFVRFLSPLCHLSVEKVFFVIQLSLWGDGGGGKC